MRRRDFDHPRYGCDGAVPIALRGVSVRPQTPDLWFLGTLFGELYRLLEGERISGLKALPDVGKQRIQKLTRQDFVALR
jgi:hypothetical protein